MLFDLRQIASVVGAAACRNYPRRLQHRDLTPKSCL